MPIPATISDKLFRGENLSVKMFGAVQDGSTDDREAIQDAINFAASNNVPLLIPGGNPFLIGGSLTIPSGLRMRGRAGAVLMQKDASATNGMPFLEGANIEDVDLEGLTIDCNRDNQNPIYLACHGLFLDGVVGAELRRLRVINSNGNGIGGTRWQNMRIERLRASAWGIGNDYAAIYLQDGTFAAPRVGASRNIRIIEPDLDGTGSGSCIKLTAYQDSLLRDAHVLGGSVKIGTPTSGPQEALGVEFWSGPSGDGGNDIADVSVIGVSVGSELAPSLTYGKSWGISLSQVDGGIVKGCTVRDAGYYFIELIGSNLTAEGNRGYNVGVLAAIVSTVIASDQRNIKILGNESQTRIGAMPSFPLAAVHVYCEGTSNLSRISVKHNTFYINGPQYGVFVQNNGSSDVFDISLEGNEIVGDGDSGSYGYLFSKDGAGVVDRIRVRSNYAEDVAVMIQRSAGITNSRFIENVPGPGITTVYAGTAGASEMIVDIANTEGINFAPPSIQIRGRAASVIDAGGSIFLDQANDVARMATARDGIDASPNVVTFNRVNFGTELQGGVLSSNSRWAGSPNWVKTSTHAYNRALFMFMGAARFMLQFGVAANANGADPGDIAFQVIDGNNTFGEPQRVETGAGFPLFIQQSAAGIYAGSSAPNSNVTASPGAIYLRTNGQAWLKATGTATNTGWLQIQPDLIQRGSGSPESAVTAPVGSLYLQSDGSAGQVLWIKESGSGNTGWLGDGGTIWSQVGGSFGDAFETGKDLELHGAVLVDGVLNLPILTDTRPLKVNGSNDVISALIDLSSGDDITGILPLANGGTGDNGDTLASIATALSDISSALSNHEGRIAALEGA